MLKLDLVTKNVQKMKLWQLILYCVFHILHIVVAVRWLYLYVYFTDRHGWYFFDRNCIANGYEQLYTRTVGYVRSVKHLTNNIIVLLYYILLYTLFFSETGEEKIPAPTVLPWISTTLRVSFIRAKSRKEKKHTYT